MSQFLFLIGIGLLVIGKVHIGNINAEGSVVRGVGFLLMMPFISVLFMAQMMRLLNGGVLDFSTGTILFLLTVDIGSMVICIGTAYMLLKNHSPEVKKSAPKLRIERPEPAQTSQTQPRQRSRDFPTLMGIAEAAHYLNVTEQDVMSLINDGKISAARINYQYRIARSVLDDYLHGNAEA